MFLVFSLFRLDLFDRDTRLARSMRRFAPSGGFQKPESLLLSNSIAETESALSFAEVK
jgi:hypothetical protein